MIYYQLVTIIGERGGVASRVRKLPMVKLTGGQRGMAGEETIDHADVVADK